MARPGCRIGWAAAALALALAAQGAAPQDAAALDRFLDGLHTLRLSFSEIVTDAQGHRTEQAGGELLVVRPGKFRWETKPDNEAGSGQLLVADGRNVWYFDRDLDQVTVKPMDSALSATPAMLLSGGTDLHGAFTLSGDGRHDGLDWVRVQPKSAAADFRTALLGFSGSDLKRMILKDKLGQTATLTFTRSERNASIDPAAVSFTPPAGADVIGTPSP
jgi:outer membrane lipoprotein carrier protein